LSSKAFFLFSRNLYPLLLPYIMKKEEVFMFDTVLFDLDGTLTDSALGIINSVQHALKKYGIEADRDFLRCFIGPPLAQSFRKYFNIEDGAQAVEYYREYYAPKGIFENEVYKGIESVLKHLKENGVQILVATSKPEEYAKQILNHFHLSDYFDGIHGATMDESKVKKEDIIAEALSLHPHKKAIMVGDREHDIIGAKANDIASIGVLYGFGSKEELEKISPDYIVESTEALDKLLSKITQKENAGS
jgi:phosphoglycolate phosphatase